MIFRPRFLLALSLSVAACSSNPGGAGDAATDAGTSQPPDAGWTDAGIPPGTTTYTIHVGPIAVSAGTQAVYCTYVHLGNPTPVDVIGFTSTQTLGGHHLILVANKTDQTDSAPAPCQQSAAIDPNKGSMIYISQVQQDSQMFPPQVGMELPANASLMLQVHYIDATPNDIQVSTTVNVLAAAPGTVNIPAAPLLFYDTGFSVPPGTSTTFASCAMQNASPYSFFMLAGHMHSTGTSLTVQFAGSDGGTEQIYQTFTWDSPQEKVFNPPLTVSQGNQFTWTCNYDNTTNTTINEPNEMCAVLGNYFPAVQGSLTCFALAGSSLCQCTFGGGPPDAGL